MLVTRPGHLSGKNIARKCFLIIIICENNFHRILDQERWVEPIYPYCNMASPTFLAGLQCLFRDQIETYELNKNKKCLSKKKINDEVTKDNQIYGVGP